MKKFILFSTMVLSLQATAGIFEGEELLSDQVVSAQNCVGHAEEVSMAMGGHSPVGEVPVDIYTLVIERQIEKEVYKKNLLLKKKEGTSYKETINKSEVLTFKSEFKGSDAVAQRAANLAAKEACEAQRAKFFSRDNSERGVVEKSGSQKADQKKTSSAQAQ
ncbi:hypothetical protein [Peredibacter starrii]|uniref:Uncharacterized protein n=1 Tax=Peredibacter starrii TaxID=28202 RepID=A0AAX4HUI8_9BACT|nr:hypothetical protein [Peredibacter starrii]WPU66807.1 hypothetical protein SOO65_08605 [Peredibacter starrii]